MDYLDALAHRTAQPTRTRRAALVAFPEVQLLDVVGPLEVLAAANLAAAGMDAASDALGPGDAGRDAIGKRGYSLEVVGPELKPLRAASGLHISVDRTYADRPEALDTLIVAGGIGSRTAARDPRLLDYVRAAAAGARRVCSVCTGALILAEAGLLSGRRVTTHWAFAASLAKRFPDLSVDPDSIYCRDGRYWTSAGVTAGMDLALALVEADLGRACALEVSRHMVFFLKRPGGQSQFSAQLSGQIAERPPLRDLQVYCVEQPAADLGVEALAARVGMSPRHFARVFRAEVGVSPGRFVEKVRVEAARRHLEDSEGGVEEIAARAGFGSAETMRRAFMRQLGVAPAAYRERFISGQAPPETSAPNRKAG